jgi:hypothetical protein
MMRRLLVWLVVLIVLGVCGWMLWPYFLPAEKQVQRQQAMILEAAGHHDWKKVEAMVADDYHDAAGMNKQLAVDTAKEMLDPFLSVDFEFGQGIQMVFTEKDQVTLIGPLRMHATGPSGSSMITDRVNQVKEHWKFIWRHEGWNPDDWKLVSVTNSEVENIAP